MIWIGDNKGQFVDANKWHTQAVYRLLKEKLWDQLNADEQEDLEAQFNFFRDVHLGDWRDHVFKEAFKVLMASEDDLIIPFREDFERAFKIDPRFQAA